MTRCRIPEFCVRYKVDIGIYDLKRKRILPRSVKQKDICLFFHEYHYCVIRKKNRRDGLLNGVQEMERNFENVQNKINEYNLGQRIRYRFPKRGTIDQLENVFVFNVETCNNHDFAEAYAAGFYVK